MTLKETCSAFDFAKLFKQKGYAYFTIGDYNLNIIGVRKNNNNKATNKFDDVLVVIYKVDDKWVRKCFDITTEPGTYYLEHPINADGTGILVPNQYRSTWKIGMHQGKYKALVQVKPVKVFRDGNKDLKYDLDYNVTKEGMFGVNIHKAGKASKQVDKWSAACQVFANEQDFDEFMKLCNKQIEVDGGNSFTYTLVNEKDLV